LHLVGILFPHITPHISCVLHNLWILIKPHVVVVVVVAAAAAAAVVCVVVAQ